jgi:hypothetical protein
MNTPTITAVSRATAASLLNLSPGTLRNWASGPGRGPRPVKLTATKQGRCLYRVRDIEAWQRDPAAYERRAWRDRRGR